jgi:hypothetical protein
MHVHISWRERQLLRPLPLRERATRTQFRILMGEGLRRVGETDTPHPTEFVNPFALPSPPRGEGAVTSAACAVEA